MDLDARLDKVAALMEERLGIGGEGFEEKLARAGRLLPAKLRRAGARLVEARALADHPKLSRQADPRQLRKAVRLFERYLKRVDPVDRQTTAWINWLAGLALNLLAVVALVLAVLVWRGLL